MIAKIKKPFTVIILSAIVISSLASACATATGQSPQSSAPALDWQQMRSATHAEWVGQSVAGVITVLIPGINAPNRGFTRCAYVEGFGSSGNVLWHKEFNAPFPEVMITTSDGGYAYTTRSEEKYASFTGPITIHKLNAACKQQWQTKLPDSYVGRVMFIQTSDGGYALVTQAAIHASNRQIVIAKTDSAAELQWTKNITSINEQYSIHSFIQTNDKGYGFAGAYNDPSGVNGSDFFIAKTDANGNLQWIKTFGGINEDSANSLIQTTDGGFAMVGNTASFGAGGTDALLIKTDAQGNLLWAHTYGGVGPTMVISGQSDRWGNHVPDVVQSFSDSGSKNDYADCLVETKDGGLAFAGETQWGEFSYNMMWLVKTDANGVELWAQAYGDFKSAIVYADKIRWSLSSFTQLEDGSFVLAGQAGGQSVMDQSSFIVKTKPDASIPTTSQSCFQSSMVLPTVLINSDGTVSPSNAPITREGNQYRLTHDFNGSLIIQANNIVLDGQGHLLSGNGTVDGLFVRLTQIGVDASDAKNVEISNLKIENFKIGVLLDNSDNIIVSDSIFRFNEQAVAATRIVDTKLTNNNFISEVTTQKETIRLTYALNSQISNNLLVLDSVWIENSSGAVISNNEFRGVALGTARQGGGIILTVCNNALVCGNNFFSCPTATNIISSADVIVAANNYTNCAEAISAYGVPGTLIYMNNFVDNSNIWCLQAQLAWSEPPIYINEVWDNGQVGNYYNNYTNQYPNTQQTSNSETWNMPYEIDENNTDNHPLVAPGSTETMQNLAQSLISAHSPSVNLTSAFTVANLITTVSVVGALLVALLVSFLLVRRKRKHTPSVAKTNLPRPLNT
ncbi:MAG: hypothetical protein NWE93_14165 [Candidatus Bathyarchaeota archaeon]|nr:hypothetical protein [Candidatus Bathyarchaeota archaeon]